MQTKLLGDFGGAHGVLKTRQHFTHQVSVGRSRCDRIETETETKRQTYRQILLVGENKEESIAEFIFVQHALQLFPGLDDTVTIVAVDHEDNTLGVLEVVSPERTDLVLTTDIPHGKLNVLVLDGLDVET